MPDLDYSEDDREQIMLVYYGTASLKGWWLSISVAPQLHQAGSSQ
jgi:hypothetical protein